MSLVKRCGNSLWCFLAVYLSCSILHSMRGPLLSSGIQSIERQFQIPSSQSGTLLSASRIGYIPTVLILAYFGSKGNRARWIGAGSILVAFGCILAALPNFLFPPKPAFGTVDSTFILNAIIKSSDNISSVDEILHNPFFNHRIPNGLRESLRNFENGLEYSSEFEHIFGQVSYENESNTNSDLRRSKTVIAVKKNLVKFLSKSLPDDAVQSLRNTAELPFGYCNSTVMKLKYAMKNETCRLRKQERVKNQVAYYMVFTAMMMFGISQSLSGTLGTPLIDDSVKRKSAPFYFAAIRSIRVLGPISGAFMAAGCVKLYVTLKDPPPGLTPTDPRWIGAWWLGFMLIGVVLLVPALLMFFFPKIEFRRKNRRKDTKEIEKSEKDETENALKPKEVDTLILNDNIEKQSRLQTSVEKFTKEVKMFSNSILLCLKSPIYVGILMGRLFDAFAFRGLSSFQSKFIENHYGIPQHQVSFFSGVVSALSYAGGIVLGSFIIRKLNLDGRRAAAYTLLCSTLSVVLTVSKVSLSCTSINNAVGQLASESNFNLTSSCNRDCLCDKSNLYPVCGRDGQSFFSPCHAGCTNFTLQMGGNENNVFSNCECANGQDVSRDFCKSDCTVVLYIYYSISVLTGIIAGTSGIPNMLISLRSVPHDVRSVAMAFSGFMVSLLSAAPSPIVVGSVIDSACLLWNNVCGRKGACLLYDASALRIRIHTMYGILRSTGLLFDIWVWYWAANLNLLREPGEKKKGKGEKADEKNEKQLLASA